jgi:tetratricopeptide (TPR) repeat protein
MPMSRKKYDDEAGTVSPALEDLIEEITVDAYGEDEQLWAFRQTFEENVAVPCDGFVICAPVSVIEFDYDGNKLRGLTARCRREDGSEHVVSASDVVLPKRSGGARYIAAYRKWMGLEPLANETLAPSRGGRHQKTISADLNAAARIELVALAIKEKTVRCRLLDSDQEITLRARRVWEVLPGEIVVVNARKQWNYAGHPYLSGEIESTRLDVGAVGLVPLRLEEMGVWDPRDEYWGEEGEPIEARAKSIIACGPRREFEMEQILPGADPDDPFTDPIIESNDLKDAGDRANAHKVLMNLCYADLRCLDAHAHLGNLAFDHDPKEAIRHYEVGLRIGELSLGDDFGGLLPWGHLDNRPFLRCMQGYALCLWRLGRFEEAERVFDRMLWLNPSDNQGARFLIEEVRLRTVCEDRRREG